MSRRLVAAAGVAVSCGAAPAAAPPSIAPPPEVAPAPPAPMATVAPAPDPLEIERRALEERLRVPLLSADLKTIVAGPRSSGGDEGPLLIATDVDSDRDLRWIARDAGDPPDAQRARLAAARAVIDQLRATPLVAFEMAADPTGKERFHGLGSSLPRAAVGEGLRVRFHEPTLLVDDENGRTLLRRAFPRWSMREGVAGQRCMTFADLSGVWGSRKLGVLVVEIKYSGSPHFCSFRPSLHAVRLPRDRAR